MKLKHIYLTSFVLLGGALATGCSDDIENFSNQVFMTDGTPSTLLMSMNSVDETREFTLSIPKPEGQDVTFTVAADASLVHEYELQYYTSGVEMAPSENYELKQTNGVIPAGSLNSDPIEILFKGLSSMDDSKTYVLPVTVTSCSIDLLASNKTQYYVFRKGALINVVPNITKNCIYPNNWATPEKFSNMTKLTVEALVYPRAFGEGGEASISTLMGIEDNFLLRFGDNGEPNQLQLATKSAGKHVVTTPVELNKWTHIAMTYDSDAQTVEFFYNGRSVQTFSGVAHGPVDWSANHSDESDGKPRCFWIGHSYSNNRYFSGEISEVRIWDRVLSGDEIRAENHFYTVVDPESDPNLLVYWKLDDEVNTIQDHSQYGNNAQLASDATWVEVSLPEE